MNIKYRSNADFLIPLLLTVSICLIGKGCALLSSDAQTKKTITVYGFSIVKEPLENEIFPAFADKWKREHGEEIEFVASFAGSETVTNQILQGAPAEVAILSSQRDVDILREARAVTGDAGLLPNRGIVNKSPFVIVVREGNPHGIKDFADLSKSGVKLILPDPSSSGGGQWSLLALYGADLKKSASETGASDAERAAANLKSIWHNVIASPGSAREARTQFETGYGDALVTYELEALSLKQSGKPFEIVVPSATVFSEHPATIIDRNVAPEERAVVEAFVRFLWSDEAQKIFVSGNLRSGGRENFDARNPDFVNIESPFTVEFLGGWQRAYPEIIERVWFEKVRGK